MWNAHNTVFGWKRSAIWNWWFLGLTRVLYTNGISIVSAIFAALPAVAMRMVCWQACPVKTGVKSNIIWHDWGRVRWVWRPHTSAQVDTTFPHPCHWTGLVNVNIAFWWRCRGLFLEACALLCVKYRKQFQQYCIDCAAPSYEISTWQVDYAHTHTHTSARCIWSDSSPKSKRLRTAICCG